VVNRRLCWFIRQFTRRRDQAGWAERALDCIRAKPELATDPFRQINEYVGSGPTSLDEEKAAMRRLNRAAFEDVVYAPTGFFLEYQAWRRNVSGIVKGPLPFFWGVSKTA
jgi:hypothetical protein